MTRVSIVTPSYNQSAYLEQTIRSVVDQDHPNIEYILIDGASTDSSLDIIRKYEKRLAYWVSERDNGQAEAINKGFAVATGEVIAWLNSDDYYLPGTIRAAVEAFESNPHAALIYGNMLAVDEHSKPINRLHYRQMTLEDLLCFQIIGQPAVFMRRPVLEKAGGLDPAYHFMLDHQLWIRVAQLGGILHVPQTWAAARYHPNAKNRAMAPEFGREAFRILEWVQGESSLGPAFKPVARRARASAHRVNARYLLDGGRPARAFGSWIRAFLIHPQTALARLNIFAAILMELLGLGIMRRSIIRHRKINES